jgi:hypothetical protein
MAKLYDIEESLKTERNRNRAMRRFFYSSKDMSIIKHDIAVKNSRIKRGEEKDHAYNRIYPCGCGGAGCFLHTGYDNKKQTTEVDLDKQKKENELAILKAGFDPKTSFRS